MTVHYMKTTIFYLWSQHALWFVLPLPKTLMLTADNASLVFAVIIFPWAYTHLNINSGLARHDELHSVITLFQKKRTLF